LDPFHVAVGVVVEHHDDRGDLVLHRGGELRRCEQEPAVARERYYDAVRCTRLRADRRGDTGAERAGEPGRQICARSAELIREVGDARHLRCVLYQDRIGGQRVANGCEIRQLGLEMGDVVEEVGSASTQLGAAVGSLDVAQPFEQ